MVWNERVSRGKEMSTSLDTEYNRHEYHREKKREKNILMNLLVKVFDDVYALDFFKQKQKISKHLKMFNVVFKF